MWRAGEREVTSDDNNLVIPRYSVCLLVKVQHIELAIVSYNYGHTATNKI